MARAKTKAAGINLPVPQNDAEAEQMIARLGASQRDQIDAQTRHAAVIAAHEAAHGKVVKDYQEAQSAMIEGLSIWASANRDRLTQGGKSKTVQLPTGKVLWRDGRFAVKHRGLKAEDVVQPRALPAAYVFVAEEAASENERGTGPVLQRVEMDVSVMVIAGNVSDATGAAAAADVEELKRAVRRALIGWQPPAADDVITLVGARIVRAREGAVWCEMTFATATYQEEEA